MYRIIGADGREYGPVSLEQLQRWVTEGRANSYTKIRREGTTEWKPLGEVPEFSGWTPAASAPGSQIGGASPHDAEAMAAAILAHGYSVQIGRCIGRGWDLVVANFGLSLGATILVYLLALVAGFTGLGALLLNFVLWGGLRWMFLKLARGQKAELADAFAGFSVAFVPLMLFSLISQVLIGLGILLCIVPGIYLAVSWLVFTELLILDKHLDFWPAMELSRKVAGHHWWQLFGLCLVCLLLQFAGTLLCVVGLFFALPVTLAATVYAYEDIFGGVSFGPGAPPAEPMPSAAPPPAGPAPTTPDQPSPASPPPPPLPASPGTSSPSGPGPAVS